MDSTGPAATIRILLASEGLADLPVAVRLVTAGGAEAAGLDDRGMLAPGLRADLVLAEPGRPWPTVCAVMRAASPPERHDA